MTTIRLLLSLLLSSLLCFTAFSQDCGQIGPALIKGKKFFDSNSGNFIPIKGINYYPRPNDGEWSTGNNRDFFGAEFRDVWERDILEFVKLGINLVRIYAVDPGLDHSGFMCALKEAGIYVIVGLAASCDGCAIEHFEAPGCYSPELKTRGQFVINIFSKYENVLAFSAGNEAALFAPGEPPEHNGPCQKKFARDMREYIASCPTMRQIPVGVVVADADRDEKSLYYSCRSDFTDEFENVEWFGINVYLHCDGSVETYQELDGFNELLADHTSYQLPVPVVVSEFGCPNQSFETINGFPAQRNWLQVDALFSPDFVEYFAGGIAFEYSAEKTEADKYTNVPFPYSSGYVRNNFGIGYYLPEDCNDAGIPCEYTYYPEFEMLQERYAAVDVSNVPSFQDYTPMERDVTQCPAQFPALSSYTWAADSVEDYECPGPDYTFICPNTPPECLPAFARPPSAAASPSPTPTTTSPTAPPTAASDPTASPTDASNPTAGPTAASSVTAPTATPTAGPTTESSTVGPTADTTSSSPPPTLMNNTEENASTTEAPSVAPMDDTPAPSTNTPAPTTTNTPAPTTTTQEETPTILPTTPAPSPALSFPPADPVVPANEQFDGAIGLSTVTWTWTCGILLLCFTWR